jgi:hypothetical protein
MSKQQTKLEALNTKLAAAQAKVVELTTARDALVLAQANGVNEDALQTGVEVTFNYGRGATRGARTGLIVGRKEAEGKVGVQLRVAVGEGFDATVLTIYAADVTAIVPVPGPQAE